VELGIGCWPNAIYYKGWDVQVLGLEPDSSKHAEAMSRAADCGLDLACRAEHLDALPPHSADAVVSTCTLCSVDDVQKTLAQVRRVLRPDGVFAFLEHVRSESDERLAAKQAEATPRELRCWGCRFDRRTLQKYRQQAFPVCSASSTEIPATSTFQQRAISCRPPSSASRCRDASETI
jgi:ubiquinone/menaquinone biosynthesis C-methylase UbiE